MIREFPPQGRQQGRGADHVAGRPELDDQDPALALAKLRAPVAVNASLLVRNTGHVAAEVKAIRTKIHVWLVLWLPAAFNGDEAIFDQLQGGLKLAD